jgi:hypothetical protein
MTGLSEDPTERAARYIQAFEGALQKNQVLIADSEVGATSIRMVSDALQRYLKDARYYLDNQKSTTSLASIAYAEGLLDALVFLGLTKRLE